MELKVSEDPQYEFDDVYQNQPPIIEENPIKSAPIKVIKKNVNFDESTIKKPIPKKYAKKVRQPIAKPPEPKITYEDILAKMGMGLSNGQLHVINQSEVDRVEPTNKLESRNQQQPQYINSHAPPGLENSYIFNKYFKEEFNKSSNKPLTLNEYKNTLIQEIIHQKVAKLRQSNYRKLVMPTSNIDIANRQMGDINNLFNFSKR